LNHYFLPKGEIHQRTIVFDYLKKGIVKYTDEK
jgi:hypothetical protein